MGCSDGYKAITDSKHEYKGHGTSTLFAALDIASGQIKAGHYDRRPYSSRKFAKILLGKEGEGKLVKRAILIEGIILLIISVFTIFEGLHLILLPKGSWIIYDKIGPGYFVLFLGFVMMLSAVVYFFKNYREVSNVEKIAISEELRTRVIHMIAVFGAYIVLIDITGYLIATMVFCLLESRLVGIKSLRINIILSLGLTVVYFIVFVEYCGMVFPKGAIFR